MSLHSESNEMRLAAGLRPDPLGELTGLPQTPSWMGGGSRQGGLYVFTVGGMDAPAMVVDSGGVWQKQNLIG